MCHAPTRLEIVAAMLDQCVKDRNKFRICRFKQILALHTSDEFTNKVLFLQMARFNVAAIALISLAVMAPAMAVCSFF